MIERRTLWDVVGRHAYTAATDPARLATCGACGRTWDDGRITAVTPAPAGRCPFEDMHEPDDLEV